MPPYVLVFAEDTFEMQGKIKALLDQGYKCQGGISVVHFPSADPFGGTMGFYQAMRYLP